MDAMGVTNTTRIPLNVSYSKTLFFTFILQLFIAYSYDLALKYGMVYKNKKI